MYKSKHHDITTKHVPFIQDLYRDLYLNTRMTTTEIKNEGYKRFKAEYPNVDCTEHQFHRYVHWKQISLTYKIDSELCRDEIIQAMHKYKSDFTNYKHMAKFIFGKVNGDKRRVVYDYVKDIVQEHWTFLGLPVVHPDNFNKEWLPQYDEILLRYFNDQQCCHGHNIDKYYELLCKAVGKLFDRRQVNKRLLDIMPSPEYEVNPIELLLKEPSLKESLKDNLLDFKKRNLDHRTIVNKVSLFLQVEGFEFTVDDVDNLLQRFKFITN